MKKLTQLVCILMLGLTIAACSSEPSFDTSSEKALESSMKAMMKDMTEEEKKEFGIAFAKVMSGVAMTSMGDEKKAEEILKEKLDGKTAKELIEMTQ